jgi:hypothetical protein
LRSGTWTGSGHPERPSGRVHEMYDFLFFKLYLLSMRSERDIVLRQAPSVRMIPERRMVAAVFPKRRRRLPGCIMDRVISIMG